MNEDANKSSTKPNRLILVMLIAASIISRLSIQTVIPAYATLSTCIAGGSLLPTTEELFQAIVDICLEKHPGQTEFCNNVARQTMYVDPNPPTKRGVVRDVDVVIREEAPGEFLFCHISVANAERAVTDVTLDSIRGDALFRGPPAEQGVFPDGTQWFMFHGESSQEQKSVFRLHIEFETH